MPAVPAELPELVIDRGHSARASNVALSATLQTWRDNDGRLVATGGHDSRAWWMAWSGLAVFRFGDDGPVAATPTGDRPDDEIRDIFLRGVVPVVMLARGCEALHASAVALGPDGVVALCAASGTGKSTLALAMAGLGACHFADDTVVYQVIHHHPVALSLPFPVRVDAAARGAAPEASSGAPGPRFGSALPISRVYQLTRDASLDPLAPHFAAVPGPRRFEVLLAHSHPFEMGSEARRRAFHTHVLAVARHTDVWNCRFAPALDALPLLAARILDHAATT